MVSKHAPSGVLTSPTFQTRNQPLLPENSPEAAIQLAYDRNVYVYRAINVIANNITRLPFRAGRELNGAYRTSSPLARLLGPPPGSPNPLWSPAMAWRYAIAQYLVTGKWAWALEKDKSGRIVGLWPIAVQHLKPVPIDPNSSQRSTPQYFSRFEYGTKGTDGYREFLPDDLIYCWRPSLSDPRQPESPLNIAKSEINIMWLLDQYDQGFLQNGGVPAHIIITAPFVGEDADDEREAFRDQFSRKFGGAKNTGTAMFAERELDMGEAGGNPGDPVTVVKIGQSQHDSDLRDLRNAKIADLVVSMGVPLSILGDSRQAKYENVEADRTTAWRETFHPTMRDLEDLVNIHLAPRLGDDVGWFETTSVPELRPTPLYSDESAPKLLQVGLIGRSEWRVTRGLPAELPKEDQDFFDNTGGDGNSVSDKPLAEPKALVDPLQKALPAPTPKTVPKVKAVTKVYPKADRSIEVPKVEFQDSPVRIEDEIRQKMVIRDSLVDVLNTLTGDMDRAVQQRLQSRRNRDPFDLGYWTERSKRVLGPVLRIAGLSNVEVDAYAECAVSAVSDAVTASGGVPSDMAELLLGEFDHRGSARDAESILLDLAVGRITPDRALRLVKGEETA